MDDFLQALIRNQQICASAAVESCIDRHAGRNTCDDFFEYWYSTNLVGIEGISLGTHSRDLPCAMNEVIRAECLTPEGCRQLVIKAWVHPEFPEVNLTREDWLMAFSRVGYVNDSEEGELAPPEESIQLWRGAIAERKHGMAWTSDKQRALWFAKRFNGTSETNAELWTAEVAAERVLARFMGRGESEYVVNSKGLTVTLEESLQGP